MSSIDLERSLSIVFLLILVCFSDPTFGQNHPSLPEIPDLIPPLSGPSRSGSPLDIGDPERGERVFRVERCDTCHSVDGSEGKMGPDLGRKGKFQADSQWLQRYLSNPRSVVPSSIKVPLHLPREEMNDLIAYLVSLKRLRLGTESEENP